MISQAVSKAVLLLGIAALCFVSVYAQVIDPVVTYPYISVTPANPAAGKYSVSLHCALGSASNACMAPTFTDIAFTIQQSPLAVYPPLFNVSLSYTTVPVPPGKMCPMIYAPVDYGPSFALGKLYLGSYTVTDQTTKRKVGTFSVTAALQALKDTVYVTPPNPTAKDSLHFDLFNANLDCCTQYYNKNVSVSDTTIVLSFEYVTNPACACLVAGSHTAFACGPQKVGRYAIYKEQGIYCATPPCPLVPGPIQLVRVGQVVVGGTAVAGPSAFASAPGNGLDLRQEKGSVQMKYFLSKAARMQVTVYNAAGKAAGQLFNGQISSGAHCFSWTATSRGLYFMTVEVNGVQAAVRKIVVSQ
jgi:hypothetical protein